MSDRVTIADSIRYGRYKIYRPQAGAIVELVTKAIPHARKLLNLPEHLHFHVRPLGKRYNGVYLNFFNKIELSVRRTNIGGVLETIMHELVHAEQFHEGRLSIKGGTYHWKNVATKLGHSYESYRKRPWEEEAFGRQHELAMKVAILMAREDKVDMTEIRAKYGEEIARYEACL